MSVFEGVALAELIACWILWPLAFINPRRKAAGQQAVVTAPAAKWGILLQMFGFALVWANVRPGLTCGLGVSRRRRRRLLSL